MDTLRSLDGTTIAFDVQGEGPLLVLVDGALSVHSWGSDLPGLLAPHFTVVGYDRRGRGGSGDTQPYEVDREIDDIEAVIDRFGDSAFLYGHSSGGPLAMRAAVRLGGKVARIALYEPPFNNDPAAQGPWREYLTRLQEALQQGRGGDAVALFFSYLGTPPGQIDAMRSGPSWPDLEAVAPTLLYDHAGIMGETLSIPTELTARVTVPALVMAGDAGFPFMRDTARTLSQTIPAGRVRILAGQNHRADPEVLAPALIEFLDDDGRRQPPA